MNFHAERRRAKARRTELSRDFDTAQLRRVVEAWKDSRFVFGLEPATRIYVAPGAPDLRKGFDDGLYGIVRDRLALHDPFARCALATRRFIGPP